jgi:hypothetical protein
MTAVAFVGQSFATILPSKLSSGCRHSKWSGHELPMVHTYAVSEARLPVAQ